MSLKDNIVSFAESQGADLVGIANVHVYPGYLREVNVRIGETGATGAEYMLPEQAMDFFTKLSDVRFALPSARSIVILGVYSLDTDGDYSESWGRLQGKTARTYAYYPVVRQIAEQVAVFIEKEGYRAIHGQQIPLKYAACEIGLGSYGWNGLLTTAEFGSYVALRAVVTDAELEPDVFEPPEMPCEGCRKCLSACPTGALFAPYKVDPALCINPLTRRKDDIPRALRKKMDNWVCGCDICQEACPINRRLEARLPDPRAGFDPVNHTSHRLLAGLARTPDLIGLLNNMRSPVMQRNAVIALANIGTAEAMDLIARFENNDDDRLDEYVSWAIDRAAQRNEGDISAGN